MKEVRAVVLGLVIVVLVAMVWAFWARPRRGVPPRPRTTGWRSARRGRRVAQARLLHDPDVACSPGSRRFAPLREHRRKLGCGLGQRRNLRARTSSTPRRRALPASPASSSGTATRSRSRPTAPRSRSRSRTTGTRKSPCACRGPSSRAFSDQKDLDPGDPEAARRARARRRRPRAGRRQRGDDHRGGEDSQVLSCRFSVGQVPGT